MLCLNVCVFEWKTNWIIFGSDPADPFPGSSRKALIQIIGHRCVRRSVHRITYSILCKPAFFPDHVDRSQHVRHFRQLHDRRFCRGSLRPARRTLVRCWCSPWQRFPWNEYRAHERSIPDSIKLLWQHFFFVFLIKMYLTASPLSWLTTRLSPISHLLPRIIFSTSSFAC